MKELRNAHGYTQEELATILNVSRSTISSWEINRTYPDLSILVSLSGLYEITVDQLSNEDDKLIDTMTKHAATNSRLKKVIITLIVGLISFSTVIVFLFNGSRTSRNPKSHIMIFRITQRLYKKKTLMRTVLISIKTISLPK